MKDKNLKLIWTGDDSLSFGVAYRMLVLSIGGAGCGLQCWVELLSVVLVCRMLSVVFKAQRVAYRVLNVIYTPGVGTTYKVSEGSLQPYSVVCSLQDT